MSIKEIILLIAKYLGLFYLARRYHSKKLRILCYHGFSLNDEERCIPGLFITPKVFRQRMQYLQQQGYQVLSLDQAWQNVSQNNLTKDSVVITIDDGFYSFYQQALPILECFGFPSTLYLTSYYFDQPCPVYSLAVKYILWKNQGNTIDLQKLNISGLSDENTLVLDELVIDSLCLEIQDYGQKLSTNNLRIELLVKLGESLDLNYHQWQQQRLFNLINAKQLKLCINKGVDIEIHTHTHQLPLCEQLSKQEIDRNRACIEPLLSQTMTHFCYPSGKWDSKHWPVLLAHKIKTATTCVSGFITTETPQYAWPRILDSARVSTIEFEAEISGFIESIRLFKQRLKS